MKKKKDDKLADIDPVEIDTSYEPLFWGIIGPASEPIFCNKKSNGPEIKDLFGSLRT
jgi:hypothetical protein